MFAVFKDNRKSMKMNPIVEADLYGNDEPSGPAPAPNVTPLSFDSINSITTDKMRQIISLLFSSGGNINSRLLNNNHDSYNLVPVSNQSYVQNVEETDTATDANAVSM